MKQTSLSLIISLACVFNMLQAAQVELGNYETFNTLNLSGNTTYGDGMQAGSTGNMWSWVQCQDGNKQTSNGGPFTIDSVTPVLRYENSYIQATIQGGISAFSLDYKRAYSGATQPRIIEVYINGVLAGTGEDCRRDEEVRTLIVTNLTVTGSFEITIKLIGTGTTSGKQTCIDNFRWDSYGDDTPIFITATSGDNGTITPNGTVSVAHGTDQTFTFTPNTGYHIERVLVDGVNNPAAVASGSYTFEEVTENHTIVVSFAINDYTITASVEGGNGAITPNGTVSVAHGTNQTFTFTPNTGYHIATVLVDGINVPAAVASGSYTFEEVTENHTIVVSFAINDYTITASVAGGNGSITPSGEVNVAHGANQIFTFTPNTGYHIERVLVDGINVPAAVTSGSYTFEEVTENHTIVVSFAINDYTITASVAGGNGSITPSGEVNIAHGATQTFTFTPNTGYHTATVLVDGINNPAAVANGSYTFEEVTENHTIVVSFAINDYTVTFMSNGGTGSMNPQKFTHGEAQNLTANSFTKIRYKFTGWNTQENGHGERYADQQNITIDEDMTLFAQWKEIQSIEETELGNIKIYSYRNSVYVKIVGALHTTPLQTVEILDMAGRLLHQSPITNEETVITLPVANGMYNVRLISKENKAVVRKVIIR